MGLRFRKSLGFGPFRLTLGKRGVTGSVGVPGVRVSMNRKGEIRRTLSAPGTGISDTEVIKPKEE
ncbi:MAG: DUF4236 domain-containing protein [bacterium]|nr:DUF4236 domain-containing protein [bacterium]